MTEADEVGSPQKPSPSMRNENGRNHNDENFHYYYGDLKGTIHHNNIMDLRLSRFDCFINFFLAIAFRVVLKSKITRKINHIIPKHERSFGIYESNFVLKLHFVSHFVYLHLIFHNRIYSKVVIISAVDSLLSVIFSTFAMNNNHSVNFGSKRFTLGMNLVRNFYQSNLR